MQISKVSRRTLLALAMMASLACGERDQAVVSVDYTDIPQLPRTLLSVTLSDGGDARALSLAELGAPGRPGREFATRRRGNLQVAFRFAAAGVTLSEGDAIVPLRSDWGYGFSIRVDSLNPTRGCFGCMGVQAFPLAAPYQRTRSDSVWLVWGGNSIRNPAIY